jgi:transglutaminase/protease-like cytokinesis protein 3
VGGLHLLILNNNLSIFFNIYMYCFFSKKIIEIWIYDWFKVTTTCTKQPLINRHSVLCYSINYIVNQFKAMNVFASIQIHCCTTELKRNVVSSKLISFGILMKSLKIQYRCDANWDDESLSSVITMWVACIY